MKKIVKEGLELSRFELTPDEAVAKLTEMGEPYKVELCKEHSDKGEKISRASSLTCAQAPTLCPLHP